MTAAAAAFWGAFAGSVLAQAVFFAIGLTVGKILGDRAEARRARDLRGRNVQALFPDAPPIPVTPLTPEELRAYEYWAKPHVDARAADNEDP